MYHNKNFLTKKMKFHPCATQEATESKPHIYNKRAGNPADMLGMDDL